MGSDKMTLLLNHPDHELDQVTQVFKKMATPTLLDVQQLALAAASGEMTDKDACGKIRDAVLEAMEHGSMLVLRLGHSAPDFMLGWNMKNVLPLEFLEPISAKPGPIAKDIACMVSSRRGRKSTKDKPTKEFIVDPRFRLVITSQFHMIISGSSCGASCRCTGCSPCSFATRCSTYAKRSRMDCQRTTAMRSLMRWIGSPPFSKAKVGLVDATACGVVRAHFTLSCQACARASPPPNPPDLPNKAGNCS